MIFHQVTYTDRAGFTNHNWRSCAETAEVLCSQFKAAGMTDVHSDGVDIPIGDKERFRQWLNNNPNSPNLKDGCVVSTYMPVDEDAMKKYAEHAPLEWPEVGTHLPRAPSLLSKAAAIMEERGRQYDKPDGERSMGKTVAAFNTITGKYISEAEGWLLMQILKDVRLWQRPGYHADSAEDGIAYSALKAEAKATEG